MNAVGSNNYDLTITLKNMILVVIYLLYKFAGKD